MKRLLNNSILIFILLTAVFACNKKENLSESKMHYCPMHPTVKTNGPGVCPICNMDLVPMDGGVAAGDLGAAADYATPVSEKIISQAKTVRGRYHEGGGNIVAEAWVDVDRRNAKSVTTFFSGRVESAEARYTYQRVTKGMVLLTVYSPELVEAQRNHLLALKSSDGSFTRRRLQTLGMEDDLIRSIEKNGEPLRAVPVKSPITGILIPSESQKINSANPLSSEEMKESTEQMGNTGGASELIRPGELLSAGALLFKIVPTNDLRVFINLPASSVGLVKEGVAVTLKLPDGNIVETKIEAIEALTDQKEDFIRAKTSIQLKNIQPGTILKAEMNTEKKRGLWVPKTSDLWLGEKTVVFIKERNGFTSREIEIDQISQDSILVMKGLSSMDEIALHAGMLQDGDTFIKN